MSDEDETPVPDSDSEPPPRRGSVLTTLLLVVNLGATAGVGYLVSRIPSAPAAPPAHVATPAEKAPPASGPIAPLDTFTVNLNEPGSSRYLKANFELEVADKKAADELNRQKRAIRDAIMRYLSNLTVAETLGEAAKTKIQTEIAARIEKEIGPRRVKRVYFTDFMVQ